MSLGAGALLKHARSWDMPAPVTGPSKWLGPIFLARSWDEPALEQAFENAWGTLALAAGPSKCFFECDTCWVSWLVRLWSSFGLEAIS